MSHQKRFFIAGTDTDVGKTLITTCLIEKFQKANHTVTAVKPVAAGCELIDAQLINSDALSLIQAMKQPLPYHQVNPVALKSAIAPHIAAAQEGFKLTVENLQQCCHLEQYQTDYILVEGAGGWLVPLNDEQTLADFAVAESLDIILVVGLKLGCINHAMLTVQVIEAAGLKLAAWVANIIDPDMSVIDENIESLKQRINAPLIAKIPHISSDNLIQDACEYVNITPLLSASSQRQLNHG
jgi:dethiobiotin synthetase